MPRARQLVPRISVTYSPVRCGHVQAKLWGAGLGLGLGVALYYNRPACSLFSVGVCMRSSEGGSGLLQFGVQKYTRCRWKWRQASSLGLRAAVRAFGLFGKPEGETLH
jgi:hypothetical protein